jgi:hypothetical protein
MVILQEQYEKFKNNEICHFLNIENYEFIEMQFKTRFHYTLTNKKSNKKLFVTFVGTANSIN